MSNCTVNKDFPSRAVHAEANAIAQAAKHGISTDGASIYVTLEPCISCLKLVVSAGIREVFYETTFNKGNNAALCQSFVDEGLVTLKQIHISTSVLQRANLFLNSPTSELRLFS
jgi:dCMP deaminase